MKYLLIISCFLFTSVGWTASITGKFTCNIKDINFIGMEEGHARTYKRDIMGTNINDIIYFEYIYSYPEITIKSIDMKGGFTSFDDIRSRSDQDKKTYPNIFYSKNGRIYINSDEVVFRFSGQRLSLIRYYKNDWNGIFANQNDDHINVFSLDCRNNNDLDLIIKDLKENED